MEENELLEDEPQKESPWLKAVHISVSVLVILGLLYLSGGYQAFFYQRTPGGVTEERTESAVDAEAISIPLTVFILSSSESDGSQRTEDDARRLVLNASRIWEGAAIDLILKNIHRLEVSDEEVSAFYSSPGQFVSLLELFDPETINVFLVRHLSGANGVAFSGLRSVAVADYTSVYDFRALAHEIGHILGLSHALNDRGRLMYRGANGINLSLEEIMIARETALTLF